MFLLVHFHDADGILRQPVLTRQLLQGGRTHILAVGRIQENEIARRQVFRPWHRMQGVAGEQQGFCLKLQKGDIVPAGLGGIPVVFYKNGMIGALGQGLQAQGTCARKNIQNGRLIGQGPGQPASVMEDIKYSLPCPVAGRAGAESFGAGQNTAPEFAAGDTHLYFNFPCYLKGLILSWHLFKTFAANFAKIKDIFGFFWGGRMKSSIKCLNKVFFPILLTGFILAMPIAAKAQSAGCSPEVWDAMKAKSEAKVAYDVAVTEQIIKKPDSVLAMTCFNKTAGASANRTGKIFSDKNSTDSRLGDAIGLVVPDALKAFYDDFKGTAGTTMNIPGYGNVPLETPTFTLPPIDISGILNSLGIAPGSIDTVQSLAGIIGYEDPLYLSGVGSFSFGTGFTISGVGNFDIDNNGNLTIAGNTSSSTSAKPSVEYGEKGVLIPDAATVADTNEMECDGVRKLWERVQTEGTQSGVPSVTFAEMMDSGSAGSTSPEDLGMVPNSVMAKNWKASEPLFDNLKDKVDALPPMNVPDFGSDDSVCDVLVTAGTLPSGTTCP